MRNLFLAITSFFATVLLLSQVALAQTAAQGTDPNLAIAKSPVGTEAGSRAAGVECPTGTCKPYAKDGRLKDFTNPSVANTNKGSGNNNDASSGNKGAD